MDDAEKAKSMSPETLAENIQAAIATKLPTIDLWGLEWWYAEKKQGNSKPWQTVKAAVLRSDQLQ